MQAVLPAVRCFLTAQIIPNATNMVANIDVTDIIISINALEFSTKNIAHFLPSDK